jgi:type I restriction enzyme S subunit
MNSVQRKIFEKEECRISKNPRELIQATKSASNYPLRRLCDIGVSLLDCEHRTPKAAPAGYPYIAIPNIREGRLDLSDVRSISKKDFDSWTKKTKPRAGDIIVTRKARVGDTAVGPPGLECAIGQNLVILRSDELHVDQSYLRWALEAQCIRNKYKSLLMLAPCLIA